MLTANLKCRNKNIFLFFLFLSNNDSYSRSKYLRAPLLKTDIFNYVPMKHKQMSFV
jgi:hypothetical protein